MKIPDYEGELKKGSHTGSSGRPHNWRRFGNELLSGERGAESAFSHTPWIPTSAAERQAWESSRSAASMLMASVRAHVVVVLFHFFEGSTHWERTFIWKKNRATLPTVHEGVGEDHHGVVQKAIFFIDDTERRLFIFFLWCEASRQVNDDHVCI